MGEDAGAPVSGGAAGDPAIKDQLDLIGPAEIEVLADHLFEKQPAVHRAIEHLGQRKLGLKDRNIVAEAGGLIGRGERMGEKAQPLAQQAVDLLGRQAVADLLKPLGIGAAEHTIVEGLIGDALPLQLTLGVFMAVEAQLGVIGKVAAELEKERPKITVDRIDVVVVDHCR